ncbi:MAG: class I SAM-dependent methyltransferase [Alphaproteobacteria bacterium]|nr:class I SAM-dependent methyltransferase [Alphaproteobacteria bacterium]
MKLSEFLERFSGGFRRKHINSPIDTAWAKTSRNKRIHFLAAKAEIPQEFIRLDPWEGEYLFIVAERAKQGIVEIGRFNGGSTFLMGCANPRVPIWSVDIAPQDDERLKKVLAKAKIEADIRLIVGDSQNKRYPEVGLFDVLFIDGDHSYDGCMRDMKNWYDLLAPGGSVLLHDCYAGCEVMDAVIDFTRAHEVQMLRSPYILASHWTYPTGSMMHFIKRG